MRKHAELQSSLTDSIMINKEYLTVAIDNNIAGVFTMNDNLYGFQYELINQFADYLGKSVEYVYIDSNKSITKKISTSEVDMVVTSSDCSEGLEADEIHTFYSSLKQNYVVLKKGRHIGADSISQLKNVVKGKEVVLIKPFVKSSVYNTWLDSVSNSAIVSTEKTEKLVQKLLDDEFEILVCDALQAKLAMLKYKKELSIVYNFDSEKSSSIYIGKGKNELELLFVDWYVDFSISPEYKQLVSLYEDVNLYKFASSNGYIKHLETVTSPYDKLFKAVANEYGKDWRLLSAIAYGESRYNAHLTSSKGAMGLMQIMPQTAKIFDVQISDILNPKTNISVAVRLIKMIEKSLRFKSLTSDYDKNCMILAAYNAGIGHVLDARRLAKKYGEDADSWSVVSKYLSLKSTDEFINDDLVKSGKCRSGETLAFVSIVMSKYAQNVDLSENNHKNKYHNTLSLNKK